MNGAINNNSLATKFMNDNKLKNLITKVHDPHTLSASFITTKIYNYLARQCYSMNDYRDRMRLSPDQSIQLSFASFCLYVHFVHHGNIVLAMDKIRTSKIVLQDIDKLISNEKNDVRKMLQNDYDWEDIAKILIHNGCISTTASPSGLIKACKYFVYKLTNGTKFMNEYKFRIFEHPKMNFNTDTKTPNLFELLTHIMNEDENNVYVVGDTSSSRLKFDIDNAITSWVEKTNFKYRDRDIHSFTKTCQLFMEAYMLKHFHRNPVLAISIFKDMAYTFSKVLIERDAEQVFSDNKQDIAKLISDQQIYVPLSTIATHDSRCWDIRDETLMYPMAMLYYTCPDAIEEWLYEVVNRNQQEVFLPIVEAPFITLKKEKTTMNNSHHRITTITYYNGENVASMSLDEILTHLGNIDKRIKQLSEMENPPKRIASEIDRLNKVRTELCDLVDKTPENDDLGTDPQIPFPGE